MSVNFPEGGLVGIGAVMVELAPVGGGLFAQGFAGDTFNTIWYLARLLAGRRRVGYFTKVGADALSDQLISSSAESGIETSNISRDPERTLGLYMITLSGAERSFTYWRDQSAARRLADESAQLEAALARAALVHVSGITLAIIGRSGRDNLFGALERVRRRGTVVSFDPNIRRRLWQSDAEIRSAVSTMLSGCDLALPSFDDEKTLWDDTSPHATVERIAALGVREIIVKNGPNDASVLYDDKLVSIPATAAAELKDTTGAGDSFNAGYLAARIAGAPPETACRFAHRLAAEVVRHPGALVPHAALEVLRREIVTLETSRI